MQTETYKTIIEEINWTGQDDSEADIVFKLNGLKIKAFCYPCHVSVGTEVNLHLSYLLEDISDESFWNYNNKQEKRIDQDDKNGTRYYCYGQVLTIHPVVVDLGTLILSYGDITNDSRVVGCFVYFVISRLDANVTEV